jgi:hypothetical protein
MDRHARLGVGVRVYVYVFCFFLVRAPPKKWARPARPCPRNARGLRGRTVLCVTTPMSKSAGLQDHIQPGFLIKFNLREFICKCVCIHRLKEVGVITGDRVTFAPIVGGDMAGADRYDDHSR